MALSLAACGTQKYETLELFAMDTYMTFVAIGDGADDVLADLSRTVNTLESSLSRTVDTSEVSRLNRDGSAVWDEDGAQLLSWALQHSQETDSAFDITIAPLVELWGITSDSPRVPSQAEIDALLPLVGYEHVHQSEFCSISLDEGCSVDLGGIAKGYAAGRVRTILREAGVTSAIISLGGNVAAVGKKPDGSAWTVGLQDPDRPESYFGTVSIEAACVVTSGAYQRYFEENGVRYHHIIDPDTLWPAAYYNGVTVLCPDSGMADCLTTALFCMPLEEGQKLVESLDGVEAMWCTPDKQSTTSSGWDSHLKK